MATVRFRGQIGKSRRRMTGNQSEQARRAAGGRSSWLLHLKVGEERRGEGRGRAGRTGEPPRFRSSSTDSARRRRSLLSYRLALAERDEGIPLSKNQSHI